MKRHVSALEARKNLGQLLETVYHRGDEVVVERAGKPMAVLIPLPTYRRLERDRNKVLAQLEQIWATRPEIADPEAEEEFIQQEIDAMRREAYENERRAAGNA